MSVPRVLLADDHPTFRRGLRALLEASGAAEVVGEAADGEAAVALAGELAPEVVVLDLQMPGLNGVEATRRIAARDGHAGVLVLTMFEDDDSVFAAMRAGARGYLLKGAEHDEIVRAIEAVANGQAIFSPGIADRLLRFFGPDGASRPHPFPDLTGREREILELIARGLGNAAIADALGVSPKTVRNNVSTIFTKLQVADRASAIVRARDAGLGAG